MATRISPFAYMYRAKSKESVTLGTDSVHSVHTRHAPLAHAAGLAISNKTRAVLYELFSFWLLGDRVFVADSVRYARRTVSLKSAHTPLSTCERGTLTHARASSRHGAALAPSALNADRQPRRQCRQPRCSLQEATGRGDVRRAACASSRNLLCERAESTVACTGPTRTDAGASRASCSSFRQSESSGAPSPFATSAGGARSRGEGPLAAGVARGAASSCRIARASAGGSTPSAREGDSPAWRREGGQWW